MGKGTDSRGYFKTKRGMSAAATTAISFNILLMLNFGSYFFGPFQMLHYLSFSYMLNGAFIILHGIVGDLDPTKKFLMTYYGSGALMYLISSFMSLSYLSNGHLMSTAIVGFSFVQGVLMATLTVFSTML